MTVISVNLLIAELRNLVSTLFLLAISLGLSLPRMFLHLPFLWDFLSLECFSRYTLIPVLSQFFKLSYYYSLFVFYAYFCS